MLSYNVLNEKYKEVREERNQLKKDKVKLIEENEKLERIRTALSNNIKVLSTKNFILHQEIFELRDFKMKVINLLNREGDRL